MVIISLTMSRTCISFVLCKRAHKKNFVFSLSFSHKKSQNYKICPLINVVFVLILVTQVQNQLIFLITKLGTHIWVGHHLQQFWPSNRQSAGVVLCFDISIYVKSVFIIMEKIFIQIQFNNWEILVWTKILDKLITSLHRACHNKRIILPRVLVSSSTFYVLCELLAIFENERFCQDLMWPCIHCGSLVRCM